LVPPDPSDWPRTSNGTLPIGRPAAGSDVRVVDGDGALATVGELHVRGAQCCDDRLVPSAAAPPSGGWFRTGDRVAIEHGSLVHLGRTDRQVTIQGHRVEPAAAEVAARQLPGVDCMTVFPVPDGPDELSLTAAYTGAAQHPRQLAEQLLERLPSYAVPRRFVHLAEIPRLPDGSVDRAAVLAEADRAALRSSAERIEPRTATERSLGQLWESVLAVESVGLDDDFFDLGGHSLKAVELSFQVYDSFGVELHLHELLDAPNLGSMASLLDERLGGAHDDLVDEIAALSDDEVRLLLNEL
jgi:acyl carrier protein